MDRHIDFIEHTYWTLYSSTALDGENMSRRFCSHWFGCRSEWESPSRYVLTYWRSCPSPRLPQQCDSSQSADMWFANSKWRNVSRGDGVKENYRLCSELPTTSRYDDCTHKQCGLLCHHSKDTQTTIERLLRIGRYITRQWSPCTRDRARPQANVQRVCRIEKLRSQNVIIARWIC